jgi:hypothetical protein
MHIMTGQFQVYHRRNIFRLCNKILSFGLLVVFIFLSLYSLTPNIKSVDVQAIDKPLAKIQPVVIHNPYIVFDQLNVRFEYPNTLIASQNAEFVDAEIKHVTTLSHYKSLESAQSISVMLFPNTTNKSLESIVQSKKDAYRDMCQLLELSCAELRLRYEFVDTTLTPAIIIEGWQQPDSNLKTIQIYIPSSVDRSFAYIETSARNPDIKRIIQTFRYK